MAMDHFEWLAYETQDEMFDAMDDVEVQLHALFARYTEVADRYQAGMDVIEDSPWREAWLARQAEKFNGRSDLG